MTDTVPALVDELDRRKDAFKNAPRDTQAEMAVWQAASRLPFWFFVNRGTPEQPQPSGFEYEGVGRLIGVYSTGERAAAVAGEQGTVLAVPLPQALDWLASFAQFGVDGMVLDAPGPWTSLANLAHFAQWVPRAAAASDAVAPAPATPVQIATDAYAGDQRHETYTAAVQAVAAAELLVVLDPQGDGATPDSLVNERGERILFAFTDMPRLEAFYAGKAVDVVQREGRALLRQAGERFDVLVLDPRHPSSLAVTPGWIGDEIRADG